MLMLSVSVILNWYGIGTHYGAMTQKEFIKQAAEVLA